MQQHRSSCKQQPGQPATYEAEIYIALLATKFFTAFQTAESGTAAYYVASQCPV
jgi:hypothetical protein